MSGQESPRQVEGWKPEEEARLVHKIDMRCLPILTVLFAHNFIRGNLAIARLKGLQDDLEMSDQQFATTISVFFVGYTVMQVPSNLIMNSIQTPRLYMAAVAMLCGLISALTALCKTFSHMLVCRLLLGLIEASFFPSSIYYLSRWYTAKELGFRIACINIGNMLALGLGGLFAAALLDTMEGVRGLKGWRWLFLIEGSSTIFVAALVPFLLADYPATTRKLSDKERMIAQERLVQEVGIPDNPGENEKSASGLLHGLYLALTDTKVWFLVCIYFTYILGLSFHQYLPTITQGLGFSTTVTLLLTFPPWVAAAIFTLLNSWHSDRVGEKFYHIAVSYGVTLIGYIVAISSKSIAGQYIAVFGMCMGYSAGIILISLVSVSVQRPPVKRAVSIALVNMLGNIGQVPGSYIWPRHWGPRYWRSFTFETCVFSLSLVLVFAYRRYLTSLNPDHEVRKKEPTDGS